ncbi:PREDICTED: universal stress protein PHOS32 [Tarenaya hassleriana]|uniref:universal stress protein PHOS32 n=1 Tax=Tarenaya hassleriana TaxID=28532 RepID=UPI00053C5080|nr:PREDICTED: universal stress protein PHOS32 [Tarenaya hassleriana]
MAKARIVGVGMDYSPTSKSALRWAAENLVDDGDHLVLIHVQPPNAGHTRKILFEDTGSPLVPLEEFREINFSKQYGLAYDPQVLDVLDTLSRAKTVKVVAKVYWGDPREKLCDAVDDLNLDCIVLGSRGLGPIKRILMGSVSNYVVTNATCPVTVVKAN